MRREAWTALAVTTGVLTALEAYRHPSIRGAVHVLLGRPIMVGITVAQGTVKVPHGTFVYGCAFEGSPVHFQAKGL